MRKVDADLARGRQPSKHMEGEIVAVSEAIRNKIGYDAPVGANGHPRFLSDFYRAQRRHLEERQLFGDARADKHHAARRETPE